MQVGDIRSPVILFGVDVQVIVTAPAHITGQIIVPYALQIGRQGWIFTGRRNQQITAVLEEQSIQTRIFRSAFDSRPTDICRQIVGFAIAQVDFYPIE